MPAAELIALLQKGPAQWNAWKAAREDAALRLVHECPPEKALHDVVWSDAMSELIRADLQEAKLRGLDLKGASLGAYSRLLTTLEERGLSHADLGELASSMIDLRNADLSEADLTGADLRKASLSGANLQSAHVRGADLSEADLDDSQLTGADLEGAGLRRAKLRGARLMGFPDWLVRHHVTESGSGRMAGFAKPRLAGAVLDDADFTGARLSGLDLRDVPLGRVASLRQAHFVYADLRGVSLANMDLREADLSGADLTGADLTGARVNRATRARQPATRTLGSVSAAYRDDLGPAILRTACLRDATLDGVDLSWMDLSGTDLRGAILTRANLTGVNFTDRDLEGADLTGADLSYAILARTSLNRTTLDGCRIHGIAAWNVTLDGAIQRDLVLTPSDEPEITVNDLEIGQFIYLLLRNERVRSVIDTITSKVVLILGRFSRERKDVLDGLREALRLLPSGFVPIVFDFSKPASKDLGGTVETLARMARFIVVDLTDPRSVPHELATVVPYLRTTPVQPLLRAGASEYALFDDLRAYPWVLPTHEYQDLPSLIANLRAVIAPADALAEKFRASSGPRAPER